MRRSVCLPIVHWPSASARRRSDGLVELGRTAMDAGARALSAPDADVLHVRTGRSVRVLRARESDAEGPLLSYDLPHFTNGLMPSTALALLRRRAVHRRDQGQQRSSEQPGGVGGRSSHARSGRCSSATTGCCARGSMRVEWRCLRGRGLLSGAHRCAHAKRVATAIARRRCGFRESWMRSSRSCRGYRTPWGIRVRSPTRGLSRRDRCRFPGHRAKAEHHRVAGRDDRRQAAIRG